MILPRLQSGLFTCARLGVQHKVLVQNGVRRFADASGKVGGRGARSTNPIGIGVKPSRSLKEILMQPTSGMPFSVGAGAVGGASLFGLGALCFYGLGMAKETGIYEESFAWPQYVRDRIKTTYMYFGSGLALTAGAAVASFRSPAIMRLMTRNSMVSIFLTIGAMIGTSSLAMAIPYEPGRFGAKQLAWALHCGVVGAVIAPLCLLGGPLILRAAIYTAGIAASLSSVAYCAPSDKFLYMAGPLAIGLGVVFAASLGTCFLAPTTALGASVYSLAVYGGLILFSAFLLYDTQKIVHRAKTHPPYAMTPYDPVNAAISIYMDVINIFIRMVMILGNGSNRNK